MKGLNVVVLSGNVGRMRFDKTRTTGEPAGSFMLAVEKARDVVTWVHVNVFGPVAAEAMDKLSVGDRVEVQGELMNRLSKGGHGDLLTEVRGVDLKFLGRFRQPDERGRDGSSDATRPEDFSSA